MKIYKHEPTYVIRVRVTQKGKKSENITLCETTPQEVEGMCVKAIESLNLPNFSKEYSTSINIRESHGTNGKSITISFKGLTPSETIKLITNQVNKGQA